MPGVNCCSGVSLCMDVHTEEQLVSNLGFLAIYDKK